MKDEGLSLSSYYILIHIQKKIPTFFFMQNNVLTFRKKSCVQWHCSNHGYSYHSCKHSTFIRQ